MTMTPRPIGRHEFRSRLRHGAQLQHGSARMDRAVAIFDEVVPPGWMVVPCDPTIPQLAQATLAGLGVTADKAKALYLAMTADYQPVAAAPADDDKGIA